MKSEGSTRTKRSKRRFDLQPTQTPLIQTILATIPLAFLLIWFGYEAYTRPSHQCVQNPENIQDDELNQQLDAECSHLVALGDIIVICLFITLFWSILAVYLMYFVQRRQDLVEEYLMNGKTIIGDVFYTPRKTYWCGRLTSYGTAVYPHPNRETPVVLQRQVFVYEKFTRERTSFLYLPGQPCSAQPKSDLQIDCDVSQLNADRLEFLKLFSIGWILFSLMVAISTLLILIELDSTVEYGMFRLPQYDPIYAIIVFSIILVIIIPGVSFLSNFAAWRRHEHWMTSKHNILQEGDAINPSGCCFDDDDCEEIEYQPSTVSSHKFRRLDDP